jgi:hypothetical protein
MYKCIVALLVFFTFTANAQELNCTVKVNFDRITDANTQIFKTLEKAAQDFVNNTRFTGRNFTREERIDCSFFFSITGYENNSFSATMQVIASRPVYNSSYTTPILNYSDKDISFRYNEGENLIYSPNTFQSNLVSILSYYANMVIGLDADSFKEDGGTEYYEVAQDIANIAQGSGFKGWSQQDGNQTRYVFVNDILSNTFAPFRKAFYRYHIGALDTMADDQKAGKEKVMAAIKTLSEIQSVRPNSFISRIFFDTKSDEIASMFSAGPPVTVTDLVATLNRLSPINGAKWSRIK